MKAALLPDRGVVKVAGEDARNFLHGLVSADILSSRRGAARFCALLSPQGKIIADFIVAEAPVMTAAASSSTCQEHWPKRWWTNSTSTNCARVSSSKTCPKCLAFWRHGMGKARRASASLMPTHACRHWGSARCCPRTAPPRRPRNWARDLSCRVSTTRIASRSASRRAASISAIATRSRTRLTWTSSAVLISPRAAMSVRKWCRAWSIAASPAPALCRSAIEGTAPAAGAAVMAGERQVGTMGSSAGGHGIALLRLDRVADASSRGERLLAGGVPIRLSKPDWARFAFPEGSKAAE